MIISKEDVGHVAHLARLHLSKSELEKVTGQLVTILSYMKKLENLDTTDIPPTTHAFSICNAFRDDEVRPSLSQVEALSCSAKHNGVMFQVPRII